jgi:hypothetical protein
MKLLMMLQRQHTWDAWLRQLTEIKASEKVVHLKLIGKLIKNVTIIQQYSPTQAATANPRRTVEQYLHAYNVVLVTVLKLVGGYEYLAVKSLAKAMATRILKFIKDPNVDNRAFFPAMQVVSMPNHNLNANAVLLTFMHPDSYAFQNEPLGITFDPRDNSLIFLAKPTPLDEYAEGEHEHAAENIKLKEQRVYYKLLRPTPPGDKIEELASDGEQEESAGAAAAKPSAKKTIDAPTATIELVDPKKLTAYPSDIHIAGKWLYCPDRSTGVLGIRALAEADRDIQTFPSESVTDEGHHEGGAAAAAPQAAVAIPPPANVRYFYSPCALQAFGCRITGDKKCEFFRCKGENFSPSEDLTVRSENFPCAIKHVAFSPSGLKICLLFVNGQMQGYDFSQGAGENAKETPLTTLDHANYVGDRLQWLNADQFINLNDQGQGLRYSFEDSMPVLTPTNNQAFEIHKHAYFLPFQPEKRQLTKDIKIDEGCDGILIWNKKFGGNSLTFYGVKGSELSIREPILGNLNQDDKYPVGITMTKDNRHIAVRYNDYSIEKINLVTLLATKSIKKSVDAITPYGKLL